MSTPTVVVGVNDTPASRQAVEAGAREAAQHQCRLELVHVLDWEPALPWPTTFDPPGGRESVLSRAVAIAHSVAPDVPVETRLMEGSAVAGLLRCSHCCSMVVIGDGDLPCRTCLPCEALAVQVAARSLSTVLITRSEPGRPGPIVVGLDDSPASERALEFAFDEASAQRDGLVVVRAGDRDTPAGADIEAVVEPLARRYAVQPEIHDVAGCPDEVLRRYAEHAGLVVVGARGLRPYDGLLGWVAQTLLHHAPGPVALVRTLLPPCRPGGSGTGQHARPLGEMVTSP